MPTNIQKNFKKQMREFQKRQKNKGDEGFYSYIERDYINNYYENKKRKRKFAISGAGIISLLILGWNIYAGSTWLNHIVYKFTGTTLSSVIETHNRESGGHKNKQEKSLISFQNIFESKLKKREAIFEYLSSMEHIKLEDLSVNVFNRLAENPDIGALDAKTYGLLHVDETKKELERYITEMHQINSPPELEVYHRAKIKQLELCYKAVELMGKYFETFNLDLDNDSGVMEGMPILLDINVLANEIEIYKEIAQEELIKAFEETGIEYKIYGGEIKYFRD